MARYRKLVPQGAPDWIVTFADLMSLLVCFFVLIISFSIQDKEKLQVVAGSMRDAFGVKTTVNKAGMIEIEGVPVRDYVKKLALVESENDTDFSADAHDKKRKQGPEAETHSFKKADIHRPDRFAMAADSLRQAWRDLPEITERSENLIVEETEEGLSIQLVDREGRAMFAPESAKPYEHTRQILERMAPVLKQMPNRIKITGHSDATKLYNADGYTLWDLTADRANAARRILNQSGVPDDRFFAIVGKADAEPLFADDAFLAANRRISIVIMRESPPLPIDHRL